MFTFQTLPVNVAVLIINFLDQVEIRPVFQTCSRWRQIGESEGVAVHLLQLFGYKFVERNDDNSLTEFLETSSNRNNNLDADVASFSTETAASNRNSDRERNNPRSLLINDPDFGGRNPAFIAHFTRILQKFRVLVRKNYFTVEMLNRAGITKIGDGLPDFEKDVVKNCIERVVNRNRDILQNHAHFATPGAREAMLKKCTVEYLRQTYFERLPLDVRLLFRVINTFGTATDHFIFTAFGVGMFYNQPNMVRFFSLEETLRRSLLQPSPNHLILVQKKLSVAFGSWGRSTLHVVMKGFDDEENEDDIILPFKTGTVLSFTGEEANAATRDSATREEYFNSFSIVPFASSLYDFIKYYVAAFENDGISVNEWDSLGYEQIGVDETDFLANNNNNNNNNNPTEEHDEEERRLQIRRFLATSKPRILNSYPNYSPSNSNTSFAKTSTIAGDIFVEMSAIANIDRSRVTINPAFVIKNKNVEDPDSSLIVSEATSLLFSYRCRIWRDVKAPGQDQFVPMLKVRRWRIYSSKEAKESEIPNDTVEGPGVIGFYPRLLPISDEMKNNRRLLNESRVTVDDEPIDGVFEYCSGTSVSVPFGASMEGEFSFEFIRKNSDDDDPNGISALSDPSLGSVWVKVANFKTEFKKGKKDGMPYLFV